MFQDPFVEDQTPNPFLLASGTRTQLYHAAKVPEVVEIIYPEFGGHGAYTMNIASSAGEDAPVLVEFTNENLDLEGCACPLPYTYSGR